MFLCTQLLMLLFLHAEAGSSLQAISPANIGMRIRNSLDTINVTWKNPNKKIAAHCYQSHVQYKSQCDVDWQSVETRGFLFTLYSIDQRKNYTFRMRMKYRCLSHPWSAWTRETYWRNPNISAFVCEDIHIKTITNIYSKALFVLLVIPFLVYLAAQKQIRRLFLPKVPDPKHTYEDLLKIDQSQWKDTFEVSLAECVLAEMETVCLEKDEEEKREEPAKSGHSEPTTLAPNTLPGEGAWPSNYPTLTSERNGYVYC